MIPMEDAILLTAVRKMDQDALEAIFDHYAPRLYSFALGLSHDPSVADYVVGDVFAKLLDQLASGKGPTSNLRSYLYQTAYHLIVDETRASRRKLPLEVMDLLRQDQDPLSLAFEDHLMLRTLLQTIRTTLTQSQLHVIVLRFVEGLSLRETATVMGKEVGNIKVIQSRAIAILRTALTKETLRIRTNQAGMNIAP